MSRVLRGAWSRRGTLGSLVAMTTVVVAGAVTVLGFARAAGTSALLTAPLLLLGAVAVPAIGRELAAERREEIGLARLRGIRGPRLLAVLVTEPLLAVVAGTVLGLALGAAGTWASTRLWLGEGAAPLDRSAVLLALGIAAVGLAVVMLGYAAALREPLAVQVSANARPRRATVLAAFGTVLAVAAAVVAVYRSRAGGGATDDLVVLLGPALVGLAVGQLTVWTVRGIASLALSRTGHGTLATFLASRRVARAGDLTGPVRLVVAAGVVTVLAATGAGAVSDWSDDEARLEVTGPRLVTAEDMGGVQALALTRRLDPDGTSLMARVLLPGNDQLSERRGYVDVARWEAVAARTVADTPAAPASDEVAGLGTDVPVWATTANRLVVEAEGLPGTVPGGYLVRVDYVADGDFLATAEAGLQLRPGARDRAVVRLDDCRVGCQVQSMSVVPAVVTGRGAAPSFVEAPVADVREVRLRTVRFGEVDVLSRAWLPGRTVPDRFLPFRPERVDPDARLVTNGPAGLDVLLVPAAVTELVLDPGPPVPVLATSDGDPTAAFGTVAGDPREAAVAGVHDVLPLVGRVGTVSDLAAGLWAAGPTVSSGVASVVVADDAPADVVAALVEALGSEPHTLADRRAAIAERTGSEQAGAYAVMAVACLAVALLALLAGAGRHRRAHERDVAALRSVGIGARTARAAGRVELAVVSCLVAVAVVVGGLLAVRLLLPGLPLLAVPTGALPFVASPHPLPLVVPALLAAAAVVVLGGRARRVSGPATRPAILREEDA